METLINQRVSPKYIPPIIPGYLFGGNATSAGSQEEAEKNYSTFYNVPLEDTFAKLQTYGTWTTWAVYIKECHGEKIKGVQQSVIDLVDILTKLEEYEY